MPRQRANIKSNTNYEATESYSRYSEDGDSGISSNNVQYGLLRRIFHFTVVPLLLMILAPNLVVLLWYTCAKCNGSFLELSQHLSREGWFTGILNIWLNLNIAGRLSTSVIAGYAVFQAILMRILPGPTVYGPLTPKGNLPVYRDNGAFCCVVSLLTLGVLTWVLKTYYGVSPTIVYDNFGEFLGTLTVFSHLVCIVLYIKGLYAPSSSDHGSSGNPIFDYYWGTELYPRICGMDVKVFTNCRFGMTSWCLLIVIFTMKSYELHGFVDSIFVLALLQMTNFCKFFWWESGYMCTIDIMVDRAGFYICWGCLTFVPGIYASVGLYLVNHPVVLGPVLSAVIILVGLSSIYIKDQVDTQKQVARRSDGQCMIWGGKAHVIRARYRLDNGNYKESILLHSGWWGKARHFHYTMELIQTVCYTATTLFQHVAPCCYLIILTGILVQRTFRDDEKCSRKYGPFWTLYRQRVPYKMIPGVF